MSLNISRYDMLQIVPVKISLVSDLLLLGMLVYKLVNMTCIF